MHLVITSSEIPLGRDNFPDSPVCDDLDVSGRAHQAFSRLSLNRDLSEGFLITRSGSWVFGRKTVEVKCHFHHIISRGYAINMTYAVDADLDHLVDVAFVSFLYCKVTLLLSLFHTVFLVR